MTSRRPIRIQRTAWGTALWYLSARASILAIGCAVAVALALLLTATRPWEQLSEPEVIVIPIPVPVPATTPPPGDVVQIPTIPPAGTPTYSGASDEEHGRGRTWTA